MSYKNFERGWFSRLVGDNGLLENARNINEGIYICKQRKINDEIYRSFCKFNSVVSFFDCMLNTKKSERCFFEVILQNQYQKPYFDIDIDEKSPDLESSLISRLKESILQDKRIKEEDILVYSSHGEKKSSYHVIINNWCLPDNYNNKLYCDEVINRIPDDFEGKKYFDTSIYKTIQQLRVLGSTKLGHDRFKKIDLSDVDLSKNRTIFYKELYKSLVTCTSSCKVLSYKEKPKRSWEIKDQEDLTHQDIENINNLEIIKDGFFSPQDPKGRMIPMKRLKESYCEICERNHENENPFLTIGEDSKIYFHCRRSKDKTLIWDPALAPKPKPSFSMRKFYGK